MQPPRATVDDAPSARVAATFAIPLRMRFRGTTVRTGQLVRGPQGWGEWSPFADHPPHLAARWWRAAVEAATTPWPRPRRDAVEVNAIVPAVPPERAHELARASGCRTVKVKVGAGDDVGRVAAVRDALGPGGRIRVDVNGAWDLDTAVARLRALARFDLEYAEQPVAQLRDFARLRARVDVPLAADESVRLAPDPLRVPHIAAADVVILKVQPLGGVWRCLDVAEACGRPVVVSSAVETSVGLAAGVALAAALPDAPLACGLGTRPLLVGDVVDEPLDPVGGVLAVRRPQPTPELLRRWAAGADDRDAWEDRRAAVRRELDR